MRRALLTLLCGLAPSAGWAAAPCGTIVIPSGLGFAGSESVNTLHPLFGNGLEIATSTLLFRPLVAVGADHRLDFDESLARTVTSSNGDRDWRITLRPATWSDGVPVTSADVLYTWRLIVALGAAYEEFATGGIPNLVRAVTAPDAQTVDIRLTRAVNRDWFVDTGLPLLVPLPAHAWERRSLADQQTKQSEPSFYRVVDGAFRLASLTLGRDATFTPNPSYVGHHPSYARLVLRFFNGADQLEALRDGQIDAANLPVMLEGSRAAALPGVERVAVGPLWLDDAIVMNFANPRDGFFHDLAVRQAMARAIDQRRLIRLAMHGLGLEQHGFVPASWTMFLPEEERGGRWALGFDPVSAAALLDGAGWRRGADGVRQKDGHALAFTVLVDADDEPSVLMMQVVQDELRSVGVVMRITELGFNQLMARAVGPASGWDAVLFLQPSSAYPDATAALASDSADNYGHFSDAVTDELIEAATSRTDLVSLVSLERKVELEQPVLFLAAPIAAVLARSGLGGFDKLVDTVGNWRPEYLMPPGPSACGHRKS